MQAVMFAERALEIVVQASTSGDPVALQGAKLVSDILRWRASKQDSAIWGDSSTVNISANIDHNLLSDDDLRRRVAEATFILGTVVQKSVEPATSEMDRDEDDEDEHTRTEAIADMEATARAILEAEANSASDIPVKRNRSGVRTRAKARETYDEFDNDDKWGGSPF